MKIRPGFSNTVLTAELLVDCVRQAGNVFYFAPAKDLDFPRPGISRAVTRTDGGYRVTLTSEYLARNVFLSCDIDGFFTDNYFDVLPGETVRVDFTPAEQGAGREPEFHVRSLVDIGR